MAVIQMKQFTKHYIRVFLTMSVFLLMGCGLGDGQRISDQNDSVGQSRSVEQSGEISSFDLRDGDCFRDVELVGVDSGEFTNVELVSCSGNWTMRILDSFLLDDVGKFPGDDYFMEQSEILCSGSATFTYFPTKGSWDDGDRTLQCVQERR